MNEPDHLTAARAVYDHSAGLYLDAVGSAVSDRFETPLDIAMLDGFSRSIAARTELPGLDLGCGTGRITAFLSERGLKVRGVDIAPGMVTLARQAHPNLMFEEGSLTTFAAEDQSLGFVTCWYSIIATPPDELDAVWRRIRASLTPDGDLLVAFQAGAGEAVSRPNAYESGSDLTLYRHSLNQVCDSLVANGFVLQSRTWRAAELAHEDTPQAIVTARRAIE